MDKCWIEFSFPVPVGDIDMVSDALYSIGCIGLNVEERALDTFTVPDPDENLPSVYEVKAYFPEEESASQVNELYKSLQSSLPGFPVKQIKQSKLQQEDWAEGWKQHFSPLRFGSRLIVKPTWEELETTGDEAIVSLDPGMAFGTGSHETTRLCLQALADQFEQEPMPDTVLDVGTGSGILAISAARLGASKVIGCEIDPEACRVAEDNVAMNHVTELVQITDTPLDDIGGCYDLVIANIMAEENVRLAGQLVARLTERGTLILSGILKEKESFVCAGFSSFGLSGPIIDYENEWCCIRYNKGLAG